MDFDGITVVRWILMLLLLSGGFLMLLHYTNVNVTQRGIGRGTACDLLGYGARGSDGQVRFTYP